MTELGYATIPRGRRLPAIPSIPNNNNGHLPNGHLPTTTTTTSHLFPHVPKLALNGGFVNGYMGTNESAGEFLVFRINQVHARWSRIQIEKPGCSWGKVLLILTLMVLSFGYLLTLRLLFLVCYTLHTIIQRLLLFCISTVPSSEFIFLW